MIAAEKEKFEKDFKNRKDKLSEEQVQQLMSAHAENMEMLSRNINVEKDRQLNSLASKIAERRKMKAAILARKHEAAVAKELVKQREERSEVKNDHVSRTEVEMFFKPINVIPPYLSTLSMSIMNSFHCAIEIQTDPIYSMRSFDEFFDYYHDMQFLGGVHIYPLNDLLFLDCGNPQQGIKREGGRNGIGKSRKCNIPCIAATSYSTKDPVGRTI